MFIFYEYAACVLVIAFGMTLLFAACVMYLVFKEGCTILVQTLRKLRYSTLFLQDSRMAAESRDS